MIVGAQVSSRNADLLRIHCFSRRLEWEDKHDWGAAAWSSNRCSKSRHDCELHSIKAHPRAELLYSLTWQRFILVQNRSASTICLRPAAESKYTQARQDSTEQVVRALFGRGENPNARRGAQDGSSERQPLTKQFCRGNLGPLRHVSKLLNHLSLKYKTWKLVYRRYAGLFFTVCVDANDNELAYLEAVHLLVEGKAHWVNGTRSLSSIHS